MGFGFGLEVDWLEVADGYDPLMFARAVKTPTELRLLERATVLNEAAIRATMASWDKGATWSDLNRSYGRPSPSSAASRAIPAAWRGGIRAGRIPCSRRDRPRKSPDR
jgi:hypothetical protein